MTEYDLIEIAKRFRALEDAIGKYQSAHLRFNEGGLAAEAVAERLNACREDMIAMIEAIRRK